ncbi:HAD-IIIC family phosphatase [Bryobacter aggregatus]|uniref:HAD-IIIC family phosphatase n=1 Tax=Bryobacter aggregatus TaxID=360054 RepID=UPI0004E200F5|nr:HAD-IIIC family phosphatase [Bryobacter aggregatus]
MTLNQALTVINSRKGQGPKKIHFLACGFEPLHLSNLLRAHLFERLSGTDVELRHGVYGDLRGNLDLATQSEAIAAAAVLEWSDLDPRLGLRASGGWSAAAKADILASLPARIAQLEAALTPLGARMPVAIAPPSLPLPPLGNTIDTQNSGFELELEAQLATFLARLAQIPGLRIARCTSSEPRLDARMELMAGFPYKLSFASALAATLAQVLWQTPPKKGLITDLDHTLWAGIVGEVGADGVSWQQDSHTQLHGLYQQMLGHLASMGVLLAVASKNEQSTAEAALARPDLFLDARSLYPVIANWGPKSASIAKILKTWNIAPDAVVFLDDSPMELEEVQQAFPEITCLPFPAKDPDKVLRLLSELRNHFGKPLLLEEDLLRQNSIRAAAQLQNLGDAAHAPEFLSSLQGTVSFDWRRDPGGGRALELINKTNQFNLNGKRISEGEWQRYMEEESTVCTVVSYQDKFGSLGRVAVLLGSRNGEELRVSHWVMSCRAFSRKIEHHTLQGLFAQSGIERIAFDLEVTPRNQPLLETLAPLGLSANQVTLTRNDFLARCGALPHQNSLGD